jgi:formate hydrogenlyase subunit 4
MDLHATLHFLLGLTLAPLLAGVINRTKAFIAGRHGQPLLQPYHDLFKLLRKGAVYSRTAGPVFRYGPVVGLAAAAVALALIPFGNVRAVVAFPGDLVLLAYLLGLMRFFTVLAALDTGSSFEGMGASREVLFSTLAEPALLLGLAAVARKAGSFSLSKMIPVVSASHADLVLVATSLFLVFLCENARIPFDDPNTHLELTMIHEVMVLDHSGPDFAFIQYAAALKFWILGTLLVGLVLPMGNLPPWPATALALAGLFLLAGIVGLVESSMARLRLLRVPQVLVGATALSALAFILVSRGQP